MQVEFFRKAAVDHKWLCFSFGDKDQMLPESAFPSDGDLTGDSSSSGNSSESDSSDSSSSSKRPSQRPSKRPRRDLTDDPPDELVVAYMTSIQHAMVVCDKDWTPYMAGRHFQSACGARLDPDRTTMSREANSALALCQRPACMRVWKALLL